MGPNGLLGQLTKTVLETALDAEERADESVDAVEVQPGDEFVKRVQGISEDHPVSDLMGATDPHDCGKVRCR